MNLKSYLSLGAASIAVLASAGAANAAALIGGFGINPAQPSPGGGSNGVVFTGTGLVDPNGNPLTDFDFVQPFGGGVGPIVELNANPANGGDDFQAFTGFTGTIKDVTALELLAVNGFEPDGMGGFQPLAGGPVAIEDFVLLDNPNDAFTFTLEQVAFPSYQSTSAGTTVSIGVQGTVTNLSDGSMDTSTAIGSFSVDFVGETPDSTRALFDEAGETPTSFNPGTFSSNFEAFADAAPVPEASNLVGLLVIGLGGASVLYRKK